MKIRLLVFIISVTAVSLFLVYVPAKITGERPADDFHAVKNEILERESSELTKKRNDLAQNPDDSAIKIELALALLNDAARSQVQEKKSSFLLEAVDLLREVLEANPNERRALLVLADLSFDQLLFSEAVGYYDRALKLEYDADIERRYAMALSFLGEIEKSLSILNAQLESDPQNFELLSFKGITLTRAGRDIEAEKSLTEALANAPSDEARERISVFLSMIRRNDSGSTSAADGNLEKYFRENVVTSKKFISMKQSGAGTVQVYLKDFPIEAMPSFAKEKFETSVRTHATSDGYKIVELKNEKDEVFYRIVVSNE